MPQDLMTIDGAMRRCEGFPVLTVVDVVCRECLSKHNVGTLPYVVRQVNAFFDTESGLGALERACSRGLSVHLLSYIVSRDGTKFCKEAAVSAAKSGRVHVLQWLSDKYSHHCEWGTSVMDTAAQYGNLQAVQYLHENRSEGCTTDAMDWAICRGDMAMTAWLQFHRTEGCSDFAMNYAAFGGHLEVLQWMSENRHEGRQGLALRAAAQNGHVAVVQWLYTRCDDRYRGLALEDAKTFGQLDVVEWLLLERSKGRGLPGLLVDGMKWMCQWLMTPAVIKTDDVNARSCTGDGKT